MNDYRTLLYVVGVILVEIRASEKIEKSKILADVVHNVPAKMSAGNSETEIIKEVMIRAERLGVKKVISNYFELAEKSRSLL